MTESNRNNKEKDHDEETGVDKGRSNHMSPLRVPVFPEPPLLWAHAERLANLPALRKGRDQETGNNSPLRAERKQHETDKRQTANHRAPHMPMLW